MTDYLTIYRSVPHDRHGADDFRRAIYRPGEFHWEGAISKKMRGPKGTVAYEPKVGVFFCPLPMAQDALPEPHSKDWKTGTGVMGDIVTSHCVAFGELDDGSIEEQLTRLQAATEAGAPTPTAVVLSGDARQDPRLRGVGPFEPGKSIHLFWRMDRDMGLEAWREIQQAIIIAFGGDQSITDPARRMRLGGFRAHAAGPFGTTDTPRVQTILHLGDEVQGDGMHSWARGILSAQPCISTGGSTSKLRGGLSSGKGPYNLDPERNRQTKPFSDVTLLDGRRLSEVVKDLADQGGGKERCLCPFHEDRSESAFISLSPAGRPYLACSACNTTWYDSDSEGEFIPVAMASASSLGQTERGQQGINALGTRRFAKVKIMEQPDLVYKRWLHRNRELGSRVTYCRSPWATGKTEWARELRRKAASRGQRVLSIVHRRSLAGSHAQRLDLPDYRNHNGELEGDVVVCLDSIRRVPLTEIDGEHVLFIGGYLLIIDEVQQVLRHVVGGTMSGPEAVRAFHHLRTLIRHADKLLLVDADLDALTVDFVREAMGWEDGEGDEEFIDVRMYLGWHYQITHDYAGTLDEIMREWRTGKRLAIPMFARRDAAKVAQMLKDARPEAKVALVTSETVRELQGALADPDPWAQSLDALVYSPSMGTGISIDVRLHFDRIIGILHAEVGTVQDALQMVHRVRNPKDRGILLYVSRAGRSLDQHPESIYRSLRYLEDRSRRGSGATLDYAMALGLVEDEDGSPLVNPDHAPFLRFYAQVLAYERRWGGAGGKLAGAMPKWLSTLSVYCKPDFEVELGSSKETLEAARTARDVVKEARHNALMAVEDIPFEQAVKIREPASRAEALQVSKAYMTEFYGDVTLDVLKFDRDGKGRADARMFVRVGLIRDGKADIVKKVDRDALNAGVPASHLPHAWLRASLLSGVLTQCGIEDFTDSTTLDAERARKALRKLTRANGRARKTLQEVGITVRSDACRNPIQAVGALLKKMGLKLKCIRIDGERVYSIEPESLTKMTAMSSRWRDKIEAGVRDDVGFDSTVEYLRLERDIAQLLVAS